MAEALTPSALQTQDLDAGDGHPLRAAICREDLEALGRYARLLVRMILEPPELSLSRLGG